MEIALQHSLLFSTKGDVPVSVVAKNLLANERLIHESLRILGGCVDGLEIRKVTVKVAHVSNTSPLKEVFALGLFMAYQKELEAEVPALLQQWLGYATPGGMKTVVTVLVLMTAIYIINASVERLLPGKEIGRLKEEYQDKLAALSKMTGLDRAVIEESLKTRMSEGRLRSLFRKAYEFFTPAKIESGVEILSEDEVVVSKDAINEIPSEAELAQVDLKTVYELSDVEVDIHRSDRDYTQSGWIAVIEEVSDKRRKLVLSPNLDPAKLYGVTKVRGDVLVVEEATEDGELVIKEYHLIEIAP